MTAGGTEVLAMTQRVFDRADLEAIIAAGGGPHYVYVLRRPDGVASHGGVGTPFYVGIGRGSRLFAHEEEAKDPRVTSAKVDVIRAIWAAGGDVVRTIDSVHSQEPWDREAELIAEIGCTVDGTGPLTNSQVYARSTKLGGIELRKYANDHLSTGDANAIPAKFKLRDVRLAAGPIEPRSRTSVFGKIFAVAEAHRGSTGAELIELLKKVDFSANKSAYTQSGQVCAAWLAGYLEGAYFRSDRRYLQAYRER